MTTPTPAQQLEPCPFCGGIIPADAVEVIRGIGFTNRTFRVPTHDLPMCRNQQ